MAETQTPTWRRPLLPRPADIGLKLVWLYALIAFPRIEASTPAEVAFFYYLFATVFLGPPAYWLYQMRDQRLRNTRFAKALANNKIPANEKIFLYLRSFKGSLFYMWKARVLGAIRLGVRTLLTELRILSPSVLVPLLDRGAENPERQLQQACLGEGTVVGIGDRYKTRGVIKVQPTDENWQLTFTQLADRATAIYCQLDHTSASLWEMENLANTPRYASKTLFLLPPEADESRFQKTRDKCASRKIELPPYDARGWIYHLSHTEKTLPYDALNALATSELTPLSAFQREMEREKFEASFSPPPSLFKIVLSILVKLALVVLAMIAIAAYLNWLR